ncbi:MAG: hypothetical protein EXR79_01115 [Myxococcales bacterium]|nr:hypothetical protein [Myxococcales bacterium]
MIWPDTVAWPRPLGPTMRSWSSADGYPVNFDDGCVGTSGGALASGLGLVLPPSVLNAAPSAPVPAPSLPASSPVGDASPPVTPASTPRPEPPTSPVPGLAQPTVPGRHWAAPGAGDWVELHASAARVRQVPVVTTTVERANMGSASGRPVAAAPRRAGAGV